MDSLLTERLVVRSLTADDLAEFLAYQSHPIVRKHMQGESMTEEQAQKYLEDQAAMPPEERGRWHDFAVELQSENRLIGNVGYFYQSDNEEADLGFQFHPDYHGKGYAFEAANALLRFLFIQLPVETVTSECDRENQASEKLIQKLGFVLATETATSVSYKTIKTEWLSKQP